MAFRILLAFAIIAVKTNPVMGADWPKWRGPTENGVAGEALPDSPSIENRVWKATIGEGYSSFAVVGEKILASGHNGGNETIYCLNVVDGTVNWQFQYPAEKLARLHKGGPSSSPVVEGELVFNISKDGFMNCLTLADGKAVWQLDLKSVGGINEPPEWGYSGSPLVVGDVVFAESGPTFALEKSTGKVIWKSQDFRPSYGTPVHFVADGKPLLAILKTDGLVILDAVTGATIAFESWETSFSTNATTPIVVGDRIFISTGYKRGCALFQWQNGGLTKLYENKNLSNHMNNSVIVGSIICGFDGNAHMGKPTEFVGLDFATGRERFRISKSEGLGCGAVIRDQNGTLIILGEKGELVLATAGPNGLNILNRAQIIGGRCWTPPVLADGRIFARNAEGEMVAVDLKNR